MFRLPSTHARDSYLPEQIGVPSYLRQNAHFPLQGLLSMSADCLLSPHLTCSDAPDHKDFPVAPEVSLLCSIFVTAAPSGEGFLALALHLSGFSHPLASEHTHSKTESIILLMAVATSRRDWCLTNWGDVSD